MTDDSVSRYFEIYRVNLNGEKKPEWFLGSNLQCCFHATVLLTVKYSAELNKYILLVRVICEKYRFQGQEKFRGSGNLPLLSTVFFFSQITLTNRIYLYNTHVFWLIQFHINVTLFDNISFHYYLEDLEILVRTIYCFINRFKAFIFLQNCYYVYVHIYSKEELPSWNKKKL